MKKIALVLALFAFSLTWFGFAKKDSEPAFVIKKGVISINGVKISSSMPLSDFKKALGAPERVHPGYNICHIYDTKCVRVMEGSVSGQSSGTGIVKETQIFFDVAALDSSASYPTGKVFPGSIKVDKLKITADLSAEQMLKGLPKWKKTDSYTEHNYRMASNGLYIYFLYNEAEDKLIKVSIGPDIKK